MALIRTFQYIQLPDPYNWFQWVAKISKYSYNFLLSYLAYSQIWLNILVDDCHFGYFTKLGRKKKNLAKGDP